VHRQTSICFGRLPLEGKLALIIEDNPLIAMNVECCLRDAGAADVKIANSLSSVKSALDEGIPFDVAVVDLHLADGNARTLVQALSERGIAVVNTTGDFVSQNQPGHTEAVTVLQKPYTDMALIDILMRCAAAVSGYSIT
jgi:DNA-binding NtrC family response regulator